MKPAIRRLKARPDFLRVAAARRKRVTPGLVLQAARRADSRTVLAGRARRSAQPADREQPDGPEVIRVGFTASRKVGEAVARNRARRRLRAAAAEVLPELGQPGYDYVLVARAGTLTRRYADLIGDLRAALANLGNEQARPRSPAPRGKGVAGRGTQERDGKRQ